eukprot:TRINITY_DN11246_c3_g1_i1.p1 TRINITY_DN11246_c3_g1~~TRINITY_DN11246_c3_g1_i1.p1  ORF type:complete len:342 (+),score=35.02 TRINITY_DN11246_c3_g1_i1:704-1729(+)
MVTWMAMVALLEGCSWKDVARWSPRSSDEGALVAARYNPFLQFAWAATLWLMCLVVQLIISRIACIFSGHDLNDFVDFCSVANVSVLILDEPFHGYYIHGKSPSSRGDWSHTELTKVLHDEDKGIGFSRGLTADGCQTFEMFLPPDMAVLLPSGSHAHFRQSLAKIFGEVRQTKAQIASRHPEKATPSDVAKMSSHRCNVQCLVDAMVHAVMRGANDVLQHRPSIEWFWGAAPQGGVRGLQHPVFFKDQDSLSWPNGLSWSSSIAYGGEVRALGVGFPTGFEWHLSLLELMLFSIVWRFQGSIFLAAALAFWLNYIVLGIYATIARRRLAQTTIIDDMFLI